MSKKLYKSKSNFTLRRLHQSGNYGSIYERDYTTLVGSILTADGQIPLYSSPSFKLTVGGGLNQTKKYSHGTWLINPDTCSDDTTIWTTSCMPTPNKKSGKIVLKPHAKRLTDFVCYSSAYDLIKTSIINIISNFPAELYVMNRSVGDNALMGGMDKDSDLYNWYKENKKEVEDLLFVDNPFNIDVMQQTIPEETSVSSLRYFCNSYNDYNIIDPSNNIIEITGITIGNGSVETNNTDKTCFKNGDIICETVINSTINIYCIFYEDDIIYLTKTNPGLRIRPKQEKIDDFFNSLNDFESVLLNRKTNYNAVFETYVEDEENGWYLTERNYKWPKSENDTSKTNEKWNLAVNGVAYNQYMNNLTDLALNYDDLYTNAIWRDMTHEAITNMDLTATFDNSVLDTSKIKQTLNIIGRQFDEIKKYIDNIKNTNTITYDGNKNTPDYFLSDNIDLSGWESKDILSDISEDIISDNIYPSRSIGFSASDTNTEFMRRLLLNTRSIFSKKGTKQGVEELLAIFGFHSTDWITAYENRTGIDFHENAFRKAYRLEEKVKYIKTANTSNIKDIIITSENHTNDDINDPNAIIDDYKGYPFAGVIVNNNEVVVPWFDKNKKYQNDIYFQSKGGWSQEQNFQAYAMSSETANVYTINEGDNLPSKYVGETYNINGNDYKWVNFNLMSNNQLENTYDHTISKIKYVNNFQELYNIPYSILKEGDIYYVENKDINYNDFTSTEINVDRVNINSNNKNSGSENINNKYYMLTNISNYNNVSGWTLLNEWQIKRVESIIDNNKGNNPHTGNYDNGETFFNGFLISGDEFTFSDVKDSKKCAYYGNNNANEVGLRKECSTKTESIYNLFSGTGETMNFTEEQSFSVLNTKTLHITFDVAHMSFIIKDILPYLKQVIPATTIFTYSFEYLGGETIKAKTLKAICNSCYVYGCTH